MRVMFLGSKRVGLRCLEAMLDIDATTVVAAITLDDGVDLRSVHREFGKLAERRNLTLHTVSQRAEVSPLIQRYRPDLCIVVGWYWLVSDALLEFVPKGFIGIHFSLLPTYRGSSPLVWAMLNGENQTGVSMFSLVKDVDAGDLWGQRRVSIEPDDYIGTVLSRLEDQAVDLMREVYPRLLVGNAKAVPQDHRNATFCSPRTPADGVIDWTQPAAIVLRFIKAQSRPYPGAFTIANGAILTIWRASKGSTIVGKAGAIILRENKLFIICGDGRSIHPDEVEQDGIVGSLADVLDPSVTVLG